MCYVLGRATTQDEQNPVFILFRFRKTAAKDKAKKEPKQLPAAPVLKPCLYKKRPSAADSTYDDLADL